MKWILLLLALTSCTRRVIFTLGKSHVTSSMLGNYYCEKRGDVFQLNVVLAMCEKEIDCREVCNAAREQYARKGDINGTN